MMPRMQKKKYQGEQETIMGIETNNRFYEYASVMWELDDNARNQVTIIDIIVDDGESVIDHLSQRDIAGLEDDILDGLDFDDGLGDYLYDLKKDEGL